MARMFQIPEQIFQATLNYLTTKPFNEVNQLVNAIGQTAKIVEVPDVAAPPAGTQDGDKEGA